MGEKTAGVGHFAIPTAPAAGTSVTSGAANVFTTTYVALSAAAPAAIFITGIHAEKAAASAATYAVVQLATGVAASEVVIGQYLVPLSTGSTVALGYRAIYPPIAVANGIRIACKTADSVGAQASLITLECINQSNVVDDGVAVGTVTTVTNQLTGAAIATAVWQDATAGDFTTASSIGKSLYTTGAVPGAANGLQIAGANAATTYATLTSTGAFTVNGVSSVSQTGDSFARIGAAGAGLTALGDTRIANLDATVSGRMASYTQPTGFLAATFPAGTVANTTNITAGTITTATNLTNAPTAGDFTATMKASITTAATAATPTVTATVADKTGYALTAAYDAAKTAASSADFTAARAAKLDNLDAAMSTRSTYAGADTSGTTTLLTRVTSTRAGNLDSLDATVSSRLAASSYTVPDNASAAAAATSAASAASDTAAIKLKTDSLTFTVPGKLDGNITTVNGVAVGGAGTSGSPWGPV